MQRCDQLLVYLRVLIVEYNQLSHVTVILKQGYYVFWKINISLFTCELIWNV